MPGPAFEDGSRMWVREFYPDVRPLLHYFLAALRLRPSREFETVVDEYAVTQEFSWLG